MFEQVLAFLDGLGESDRVAPDIRVAVAALLVQAARMDDHFDPAECQAIRRLLARQFALEQDELAAVMKEAERAAAASSDLFGFTHVIVDNFSPAERIRLIEMLWEVGYADGTLDPEEDMLIRRIAGLIHVEDHARGEARLRVMQARADSA